MQNLNYWLPSKRVRFSTMLLISIFFLQSATGQVIAVDSGDLNQNDGSFKPSPGSYILSCWVKENQINAISYSNSIVQVTNGNETLEEFSPSGNIIDGWQRIEGVFNLPNSANELNIKLVASNPQVTCYFDDIRIVPFNGNMKSFVYDPITQRLMAELDENNYATFYEYDQEGGLIRVKKETERGVYTIQETRSSSSKINN